MKLELVRERKVDLSEESGIKTWYWVLVNGEHSGSSRPFTTEKDAQEYYDALKSFYLANGTCETITETFKSEEIQPEKHIGHGTTNQTAGSCSLLRSYETH